MTVPFRTTLLASALALALPGALYAQQQGAQQQGSKQRTASQQQQQKQALGAVRASDLKDMQVIDAQGRDIGEISEIVVDRQSGRIHAAVVEFGGLMGVGEKQYAFPVSELKPTKERNQVMLNVDKQKLEDARGFEKNAWPDMNDDYWGRIGGSGKSAAAGTQDGKQAMRLTRLSELMGKDVQAKGGEEIGEVNDVILDLQKGQVRNVVLDLDEGGRATVPMRSLSAGEDEDKLVTSMTREQLTKAAR